LVCDESEEVSVAAQEFLEFLLSSQGKHTIEDDVAEIFTRFVFEYFSSRGNIVSDRETKLSFC